MLDLQQLRYFVAVAEEEHVGRAADKLALSPSPLSRQVRALEARLGTTLFDRAGNRIRLTEHGRALLADARALLALADTTEARARDLAAGRAGTLRVGYVEGAMHASVLPDALRRLTLDYPGLQVQLSLMRTAEQHAALTDGSLDVAITYASPPERAGLVSDVAVDEAFVIALPAEHPLTEGTLTPAALQGAAFIAPPRTRSAARDHVIALCAVAGFQPDVRFEAAEPTAVLALVGAGLGLAIVQESLAQRGAAGVVFRPLPPLTERMRIYVSRRETSGQPARQLAALLAAVH